MKTLTQKLQGRAVRVAGSLTPMCNQKLCSEYGEVYDCYTHAYLLCHKFPDKPVDLVKERQWNQL